MPNPLIFLVAIVVIDLVLKSVKNKKKVEEARRTSMDQTEHKAPVNPKKTSSGGSIRELRRMLEEELEKGKKQDVEKTIDTIEKRKTRDDLIAEQRNKINKHSELEKMKRRKEEINKSRDSFKNGNKVPIREVFVAKSHKDKNEFREDLVKGIIFSEILGKPKSMKK